MDQVIKQLVLLMGIINVESQVIKQLVVLMGIINVESGENGEFIGDTFR